MKNKGKKPIMDYNAGLKDELDARYADYKSGRAKVITAEESKKRIQALHQQK